jgi:hypothetical protein
MSSLTSSQSYRNSNMHLEHSLQGHCCGFAKAGIGNVHKQGTGAADADVDDLETMLR